MHAFGRSEEVIDLLRHLPYIKQLDGDSKDEMYFETQHLSYLRDTWPFKSLTVEKCQGKQLFDKLLMPSPEDWPAGSIALTQDIYATWWIIDTAKGLAILSIHIDHQGTDIYARNPTCGGYRLHRATKR
jgi:hypothetical protein